MVILYHYNYNSFPDMAYTHYIHNALSALSLVAAVGHSKVVSSNLVAVISRVDRLLASVQAPVALILIVRLATHTLVPHSKQNL